MDKGFINTAFTKGVNDYLSSCDDVKGVMYNSFLVVVIRALISIYSELDVINPMIIGDTELFKDNLAKYGYSKIDVNVFLSDLELYEEIEKKNEASQIKEKNPYFVLIQKELVDMFIKKKLNYTISKEELNVFYDLLYTPYSKDPLRVSYNFLTAVDVMEVDRYFREQMKNNVKVIKSKEKHYLNVKAYEILNYSMDNLAKMSDTDLANVNSEVYDYFGIRENAINKEYLLDKALNALDKEKNAVTSGNGYVDILLVLSVICTVVMIILVVAMILV